jgi:hypothetical protein
MNIDTGELLTKSEAIKQWKEEYDGEDDTNILDMEEQYIKVEPAESGDRVDYLCRP